LLTANLATEFSTDDRDGVELDNSEKLIGHEEMISLALLQSA